MDNFCWHALRTNFVDTFYGNFLWTIFCGHLLLTICVNFFSGFFVVNTFCGHFLWPLFKIFFMDTFCRYFWGTINCSAKIMDNKKHNEKPKFILLRHTSYELSGSTDTFCLMMMWGSIFCLFFYLRCIEYLHGLYQQGYAQQTNALLSFP